MVIGMSMLNTMILASTLVVTRTGFSTLHSTLPVLVEEGGVCGCWWVGVGVEMTPQGRLARECK